MITTFITFTCSVIERRKNIKQIDICAKPNVFPEPYNQIRLNRIILLQDILPITEFVEMYPLIIVFCLIDLKERIVSGKDLGHLFVFTQYKICYSSGAGSLFNLFL